MCRSGSSRRYSGEQSNESSRWGLLFAPIARARRNVIIADLVTEWLHVVSERPKGGLIARRPGQIRADDKFSVMCGSL